MEREKKRKRKKNRRIKAKTEKGGGVYECVRNREKGGGGGGSRMQTRDSVKSPVRDEYLCHKPSQGERNQT